MTQRFTGTENYVATDDLKVAVNAAVTLRRPLLVKGEPGTGKTVLAHEIANAINAPLIEWGVKSTTKAQQGLYEYDAVSRLRDSQLGDDRVHDINNYIRRGKLWEAFTAPERSVLLIDEIDRADEEFEAFLLEILSDYQVSIPELGTVSATSIPRVILTSNGTRELSDALRRRCLYHYVDYPTPDREARILLSRVDGLDAALALQVAELMAGLRKEDLAKVPGVAETIDWASALLGLGVKNLHESRELVFETLACVLKTREDTAKVSPEVTDRLLGKVA